MGSMTMPSHFTTLPIFREGLMCLRSGAITVGPVTTSIAPNRAATRQSNPSTYRVAA